MTEITGDVITNLAELGKRSSGFELFKVASPSNDGLPAEVTIGFDHKSTGPVDLRPFIERWRTRPERKEGIAHVTTLASFMDLLNRHKTPHSAIFATTTWPNPSLTGIVDYHELAAGAPAFARHRVSYAFPVTDEFAAWANGNGKPMGQGEFAAFIEEHVADLAAPSKDEEHHLEKLFATKFATPADMIMLSRGIAINVKGRVASAVVIQSGESEMTFSEEHANVQTGKKLIVPGLFMLALPVFLDGDVVRLPARLRYRVQEGAVSWFYQLYRWKQIVRERVVADLETAIEATSLPAFEGAPEK